MKILLQTFLLPEAVLVTQSHSWEVHFSCVYHLHIHIGFEVIVIKRSDDDLWSEQNNGSDHRRKPQKPVTELNTLIQLFKGPQGQVLALDCTAWSAASRRGITAIGGKQTTDPRSKEDGKGIQGARPHHWNTLPSVRKVLLIRWAPSSLEPT